MVCAVLVLECEPHRDLQMCRARQRKEKACHAGCRIPYKSRYPSDVNAHIGLAISSHSIRKAHSRPGQRKALVLQADSTTYANGMVSSKGPDRTEHLSKPIRPWWIVWAGIFRFWLHVIQAAIGDGWEHDDINFCIQCIPKTAYKATQGVEHAIATDSSGCVLHSPFPSTALETASRMTSAIRSCIFSLSAPPPKFFCTHSAMVTCSKPTGLNHLYYTWVCCFELLSLCLPALLVLPGISSNHVPAGPCARLKVHAESN